MSHVGIYYWRGRPLNLMRDKAGKYFVQGVPALLKADWLHDVKRGKIKLENP